MGAWLTATRTRVLRRPRAALTSAIRREVRHQQPDRQRLIDDTVRSAALAQRLQQAYDEQWQELQAALAPSPAQVDRQFSADVFFGRHSGHDRTLVPSRYDTLATEIQKLTACRDVRWPMQQAYRAMLAAEALGLGRIAGTSYNIIGKLVVPPLLGPPAGPILEIGTLYGLFSPVLVRQFHRVGEFRHLTVVDPLEGTQIQPGTVSWSDPSGTPVRAGVVRHNARLAGLAADEFRLVQGLSTAPDVRAAAGDRAYAVIIVDGDHSEAGVLRDLHWAEKLLLPGGVAVVDDLGDRRWPGVARALERYLGDGGRLELLGVAATSGYLRQAVDDALGGGVSVQP